MLLAFLVGLPLPLLGIAPGTSTAARWAADLFPLGHSPMARRRSWAIFELNRKEAR